MSSIPAVLAALATLADATTDDSWLVINGPIGSETTTKGNLVLVGGDEILGTIDLDSMGLETSEERYTVPVSVLAFIAGSGLAAANTLALATFASLERAIREYPLGPTLGVTGVLSALPTGAFSLNRVADGEARYAALRFVVEVWAQNT